MNKAKKEAKRAILKEKKEKRIKEAEERAKRAKEAKEKEREANAKKEMEAQKMADMEKRKLEEIKKKKKIKICRWLGFGVILSCVPIILSVVFNWIVGYNFSALEGKIEYFTDFVLVVFSVAVNACSYATDGRIRWGCTIISIISIGFGIVAYSYFFGKASGIISSRLSILFGLAVLVLIVNAGIGLWIELHSPKNYEEAEVMRGEAKSDG